MEYPLTVPQAEELKAHFNQAIKNFGPMPLGSGEGVGYLKEVKFGKMTFTFYGRFSRKFYALTRVQVETLISMLEKKAGACGA